MSKNALFMKILYLNLVRQKKCSIFVADKVGTFLFGTNKYSKNIQLWQQRNLI